ncbi:MAG: alpha/beta fold hydrolase, partial [Chloroflexota bacterium]
YAGGSPAAFNKWTAKDIETYIAHYPGRGSRFNEPPMKRIDTLVENILQAIQPLLDKPFALFGHSMGGLIAFELARKLRQQKQPQPKLFFVSASVAPQFPDPNPPIHALPDDEFLDALKKFNGIPAEILNQPEALKILIPILRADFEAVESYHFDSSQPLLDIPIIAIGGLDDPRVNREQLEGWADQTTSRFEAKHFPGGHFFITSTIAPVLRLVAGASHAHEK